MTSERARVGNCRVILGGVEGFVYVVVLCAFGRVGGEYRVCG